MLTINSFSTSDILNQHSEYYTAFCYVKMLQIYVTKHADSVTFSFSELFFRVLGLQISGLVPIQTEFIRLFGVKTSLKSACSALSVWFVTSAMVEVVLLLPVRLVSG